MNQMPMNNQPNFDMQNRYNGQMPPQQGQSIPQYGQAPQWNGQSNQPLPNQPMPNQPNSKNGKKAKKAKKTKKNSNTGWVFFGIFLMFALIIGGGLLGYKMAVNARMNEYNRKKRIAAAEQYQMALTDINQGKLENAKTRMDYVLSIDPNYPGASETYADLIIALMPKDTPTPMPTPTIEITATPDYRGEEEMFNGITTAMYNQNWENAIAQIKALRDKNLTYRAADVDGMYYIALRNLGIALINGGYLEQGVYDITMAESFGPIDTNAKGMRDAARSYLSGAGYWEIDWDKALEYYSNAYLTSPNIFDRATGMTAMQRYAQASFAIANKYIISEDYCGAIPYYEQGLNVLADENYALTATAAYTTCYPPTEIPSESSYYESNESVDEGEYYYESSSDEDYEIIYNGE